MINILTYLQELLNEKQQSSTLLEADQEIPYPRLIVVLESPHQKEGKPLEITAHPQHFEGTFTKENTFDAYYLLQFQYILSQDIPPDTFNQVSSALHFFNRLLHCPGFELDELNNHIVYRYVWFIKQKGIDTYLLMQVIENIHLCFNMFGPYIKEIAQGRYTLEDILEQIGQFGPQQD